MRRIARRFSSPVLTAVIVAIVVGGATAAAAPTAVTSVVKFAKRANFAKRAAVERPLKPAPITAKCTLSGSGWERG